jgi:hypothetical protein
MEEWKREIKEEAKIFRLLLFYAIFQGKIYVAVVHK